MAVRIVDMRGVDLERYDFDWDLTFAALVMHPDGTIYHRYGGRDHRGAGVWLSERSFESFLRQGLETHAAYLRDPHPPGPREPLYLEDVEAFAVKDKGECIHCHSVFPSLRAEARERGEWGTDGDWIYPPPSRLGLDLGRDDQRSVTGVEPETPAARAGLLPGDRLISLAGRGLATASDLSAVLHGLPAEGGVQHLTIERAGIPRTLDLELATGWKRGTPLSYSWRPLKWALLPAPGFGGPLLTAEQKQSRGIDPEVFAFRVQYTVTWGENRRFGQAANRAGLRQNDVVLGTMAKRDFETVAHFHSWWRLTRKPGEIVE
ncbi:MAG: PDZ domain-containing protein, partial [Planctomycetota bacterium]